MNWGFNIFFLEIGLPTTPRRVKLSELQEMIVVKIKFVMEEREKCVEYGQKLKL